MEVKIDGEFLQIRLPIRKQLSKSQKTMLIATSGGNKETTTLVDGKPLTVGVNAYTDR